MSVIIFLLILSVLVLIHELGHYVAARIFGVKAEEFGYGFPPRAIGFVRENGKWKRVKTQDRTVYNNTVWSINWLPLGGFVRLKGEQGDFADQNDSFQSKSWWKKFIILAAGVFMNWFLAGTIFATGFFVGVPTELAGVPSSAHIQDQHIEIVEVAKGSSAEVAGIKAGDRLLQVDEFSPATASDTRALLASYTETMPAQFLLSRDGKEVKIIASPTVLPEVNKRVFGVTLTDVGEVSFPFFTSIAQGYMVATHYAGAIVAGFGQLIVDLFRGGSSVGDVSGPVGIAVMTGQVSQRGLWALAQFTAILSLNLAVINFLPIPALDGGRALFVLFETIRRKKHDPRTEAIIHQIGFVALITLILVVTAHDLIKYGSSIWNGLLGIFGI